MQNKHSLGFTLMEVIIAMAIMTLAFASILSIEGGSITATTRAKQMNIVGMLAKNQMVETEFKIMGKKFDSIQKEEAGKFPAPYEIYSWKTAVKEIKFPNIAGLGGGADSTAGGAAGAGGLGATGGQNSSSNLTPGSPPGMEQITKIITDFFSKAMREVTVTVLWKQGTKEQSFSLTTFWVDLNYEINPTQ